VNLSSEIEIPHEKSHIEELLLFFENLLVNDLNTPLTLLKVLPVTRQVQVAYQHSNLIH
jgi:hypothetical protein